MTATTRPSWLLARIGGSLCVIALLIGGARWSTPAPQVSVWSLDPAHEQWSAGKSCSECHQDLEGSAAPAAPRYHGEDSWRYVHGRTREPDSQRCFSCHTAQACESCHQIAPDSHTQSFRRPASATNDARRHALLGRLRPSSCMACHRSLPQDCSDCHVPSEIQAWTRDGAESLSRWPELSFTRAPHD